MRTRTSKRSYIFGVITPLSKSSYTSGLISCSWATGERFQAIRHVHFDPGNNVKSKRSQPSNKFSKISRSHIKQSIEKSKNPGFLLDIYCNLQVNVCFLITQVLPTNSKLGFLDIDITYESVAQVLPSLYRGKTNGTQSPPTPIELVLLAYSCSNGS